ncbi:unnamed protein product [Calypogeia fissa]
MDHDQHHSTLREEDHNHMDSVPEVARAHWEQLQESRTALHKIAHITAEKWAEQEFVECDWDYVEAAYEAKKLKEHAMICYFTDRAPLLHDFKDWIEYEMEARRGWPIKQIKFLGKNLFMVYFEEFIHREEALTLAPWFMENRFVYTFRWEPHFDVRLETYTLLPVWIEIPFRSIILEKCRKLVAGALGKILYYVQGDEISSFPHDRACILWDTCRPVPKSVKINLADGLAIWQPVTFRNIPYHCYKCRRKGHLARDCNQEKDEAATVIDHPNVDLPAAAQGHPVAVDPETAIPPETNRPADESDNSDSDQGEPMHAGAAENDDEDGEEQEQIAAGSPDVEVHDMDLAENGAGVEGAPQSRAPADEYIENIAEDPITTPLNAATQTPPGMHLRVEDTPMIPESDGDKSNYEAHFSQSQAKGDKAHKQANRTPETDNKSADKTGKKQRKQLQFPSQDGASPAGDPGKNGDTEMQRAVGGSKGDTAPKQLREAPQDRRDGSSNATSDAPKPDRRRGKEAGASKSPGK